MITIRTNHGEFTGQSVDSIVRREYGKDAFVKWSEDATAPEEGLICHPSAYEGNAYLVDARLIWVEE